MMKLGRRGDQLRDLMADGLVYSEEDLALATGMSSAATRSVLERLAKHMLVSLHIDGRWSLTPEGLARSQPDAPVVDSVS